MNKFLRKIVVYFLITILTLTMGFYAGIKNAEDSNYQELNLPQLKEDVKVYRDEYGVPYIIAKNIDDQVFVQGYEITRDRTFQMEYYRSLINGEFSRILGESMIETDMALRDMGLKRAALSMLDKINPVQMKIIESYTDGVNAYLKDHIDNQAMELQLLGVKAKPWGAADVVAMGSIVAFSWALGGMFEELLRLKVHRNFGNEKALELFPVNYPPAYDFLKNVDHELIDNSASDNNILEAMVPILGDINTIFQNNLMSNNWVISGNKTTTGNPIVANDPHQSLEAPGIWYRVNLFLDDDSLTLQGMTFPGIPLITFGRNKYVAWGITAGLHDSTDLFYLKQNIDGSKYLVNNTEWIDFEYIETSIPVKGKADIKHNTKLSIYGPMIDTDEGEMAMRWTLHEGYARDQSFKSLIDFNFAKNVDEFHDAIRYLLTGFNFVFADIEGNIASQVSGFLPIRKIGNGLLPQNGSNGKNDWIGLVPYDDQYFIKNPITGYLATANERVDSREQFFIGESFALSYRDDRISEIIENGTDFEIDHNYISVEDNKRIQLDVKTLVADDLLAPVIDVLQSYKFTGVNAALVEDVVDLLSNWDHRLNKDEIAPTVYTTYRYMLTKVTFEDELGDMLDYYYYSSVRTLADWIKDNRTIHWFDDNRTSKIESANDMVISAMERTVNYLVSEYGEDIDNWVYGRLHRVYLIHPLNSVTSIFNIGGDPISGGIFTILSSTERGMRDDKIDFSSRKAPYFRFVIEVEPTWSNEWGAVSSGASGNPLSKHYSDAYESWVQNKYDLWLNNIDDIENTLTLKIFYTGGNSN